MEMQSYIRSRQYFSVIIIYIFIKMFNVFIPDAYIAWLYDLELKVGIELLFVFSLLACVPKVFFYERLIYFYAIIYFIIFEGGGYYFDIYAEGAIADLYDGLIWWLRLGYFILCAIIFCLIKWKRKLKDYEGKRDIEILEQE